MSNDDDNGTWEQWHRLILSELKRLGKHCEKSDERYDIMKQDLTRLKVWSAMFGFLGGITATLLLQKIIVG